MELSSVDDLLDTLLAKAKESYSSTLKEDEVFELYCADNMLINYDLDYTEIESGIVDGPRDAGLTLHTFL